MAKHEHWEWIGNDREMWEKLIGQRFENPDETETQAAQIFEGTTGHACLEIGAGIGRLLRVVRGRFRIALGVDWSKYMVQASHEYLRDTNAAVILSGGWDIPFPAETFDFVYSFTCFQHMEELDMIRWNLREARRVLTKRGRIVVQTVRGVNGTGRHDGYVFPTEEDFGRELATAGFIDYATELEDEWIWARAFK